MCFSRITQIIPFILYSSGENLGRGPSAPGGAKRPLTDALTTNYKNKTPMYKHPYNDVFLPNYTNHSIYFTLFGRE